MSEGDSGRLPIEAPKPSLWDAFPWLRDHGARTVACILAEIRDAVKLREWTVIRCPTNCTELRGCKTCGNLHVVKVRLADVHEAKPFEKKEQ
jgi:hypothetical protein